MCRVLREKPLDGSCYVLQISRCPGKNNSAWYPRDSLSMQEIQNGPNPGVQRRTRRAHRRARGSVHNRVHDSARERCERPHQRDSDSAHTQGWRCSEAWRRTLKDTQNMAEPFAPRRVVQSGARKAQNSSGHNTRKRQFTHGFLCSGLVNESLVATDGHVQGLKPCVHRPRQPADTARSLA